MVEPRPVLVAEGVLLFEATVKPMHDRYVEPCRHLAHRVVGPDEDLDTVAAELASDLRSLAAAAA